MKALAVTLLLGLLACAVPARAEIEKFGNVDVNYNVITTDTLSPAIAKAYGIERSSRRGLLTVAITQPNENGLPRHVSASVAANALNLVEQMLKINLRRIEEGNATYYIGDFALAPPDRLRFTIDITETAAKKAYKIEFQKDFQTP